MNKQDKRFNIGEVFTPQEICNTLIRMSRYCKYNQNYKDWIEFCDTSCGIGNIIIRFLDNKFNYCNDEWEVIELISHIHGYDIDQKNVNECKKRIFDWTKNSILIFTDSFIFEKTITEILDKNIICCDYLTTKVDKKFDLIIQNPPYIQGLYLKFLEKAYNDLNEAGEMVSIQPATWLLNFHTKGYKKTYDKLKRMFSHLTDKVIIENYNDEFGTSLYVPYSIIHVDNRNIEKFIDVEVIGENFTCECLSDINLIDSTIGAKEIILDIINKCKNSGGVLEDFIYKKGQEVPDNTHYIKFLNLIGRSFCGDPRVTDEWYENELLSPICYYAIADKRAGIKDTPHYQLANGRTYQNPLFTNTLSDQIYGTKEELENFMYNVYNCDLFPFLGIIFNFNMRNQCYHYVPFLSYSKYYSDEIYKILNLTDQEIGIIEKTIKKFKRGSNWYKRLQFGYDWKNKIGK